jgi:hypothetical protein
VLACMGTPSRESHAIESWRLHTFKSGNRLPPETLISGLLCFDLMEAAGSRSNDSELPNSPSSTGRYARPDLRQNKSDAWLYW